MKCFEAESVESSCALTLMMSLVDVDIFFILGLFEVFLWCFYNVLSTSPYYICLNVFQYILFSVNKTPIIDSRNSVE